MRSACSIVMKRFMEHCDDKSVEHCDDKRMVHCDDVSWILVLTMAWSIVMQSVMEDSDDKGNGAL